ncbi:PREDICTED: peroxisomal targeting signal 2 receptor-like [Amphimedon queenslandica]|uniref:Peroxin-7 n=1 Tax=Amphimedon queenslandica TaxID=400682 RepID=A0A1X7T3P4_AMPQE|nr:PREDICTED: peroxisomal targeting signal 2 receptor-like [Amphimedon queenslandica]|eukprot:XP_003391151.1 PREDICTED: peroxisomal targeting signal 2 receptor-like [Amphimedon queenslandica]
MASTIPTSPIDGYSVLFSPFSPNLLGFVGGSNYGIAGKGGLIIIEHGPTGYKEIRRYGWKDVLYDVTWSEIDESVVVVASGDGNIVIFNITQDVPVAVMSGHLGEVSSVEWSLSRREQHLISSSWDKTIKLWDPATGTCLNTLSGHTGIVYSTNWSPHIPNTVASVSGDYM